VEHLGVEMKEPYTYLEWDKEKISRLWDFESHWAPAQNEYFSKMVGAGIVNFLKKHTPLKGRVIDYGCGPGYLVHQLLKTTTAKVYGVDLSKESADKANVKFFGYHLWYKAKQYKGGVLPYESNYFDQILFVETIEHMTEADLDTILFEFKRILKPGGQLFITTPNNEDLASNMVFCPCCSQVFHKYQHMRAFTKDSLCGVMSARGYVTQQCGTTDFNDHQCTPTRQIINAVKSVLVRSSAPKPHLYWLGKKA